MPLILRIKSGPLEGKSFAFADGAVVGRGEVEISIPDPKISTRHAQITKDKQGSWVMTDLGSMNGLRVSGKKLAQVTLSPGTEMLIGRTYVEVVLEGDRPRPTPQEDNPDETPEAPLEDDATVPPLPALAKKSEEKSPEVSAVIEVETQDWNDFLSTYTLEIKEKVKNSPRDLVPFSPCLVLTFIRGIQAGTEWVLGYGPRLIGAGSMDLPLLDPALPDATFRVSPKGHKALFSTEDSQHVRLNGNPIASDELNEGDTIKFGQTQIRVGYRE